MTFPDLPNDPSQPAQFHDYRGRHLFFNDHYLGKANRGEVNELVIFPEFREIKGLEDALVDWAGRKWGVRMPVRSPEDEETEKPKIKQFPAWLEERVGAEPNPYGDCHPDYVRWALKNMTVAEFNARYAGRLDREEEKARFADDSKIENEPTKAEKDAAAKRAKEAKNPPPPKPPTPEHKVLVKGGWDEELDGPAPKTFVCCDCVEKDKSEEESTHPIDQMAGRREDNDLPVCMECAASYTDGGGA